MGIFILYVIVISIYSFILFGTKKRMKMELEDSGRLLIDTKDKKKFVFLSGTLMFLISGLRHYTIGTDTFTYVNTFKYWIDTPLQIYNFSGQRKEIAYVILNKAVSYISHDYSYLLLTISLIFAVAISVFIYRYSKKPILSYICMLCLGYFYFSMTGLRQIIAMSILIFSYKYVRERKLIPFLILVLMAYPFHNTSVVFLLAYPIATSKVSWKKVILVAFALISSFYFESYIRYFLFDILKWERLSSYQEREVTLNLTGFIIQFSIMVFCLIYYKVVINEEPKDKTLYNIMVIGVIFQVYTTVVAEFFRISMYFSIYNIVLIPNCIESIKNTSTRKIVYTAIISLLLIYFVLFSGTSPGVYPFKFFWEAV